MFFLSFFNNTKGTNVTNPPNNTPSNFTDCQLGHVQNVHPGRARPPRDSDPRRALLDEEIEHDGETHSAANLFDAMKEGYYGKF